MTAPIGSFSRQVPTRAVTASTTATVDDYQITGDATSGAITVTLFASPADGAFYELVIVKTDSGANAVTVTDGGSFSFILTQPQSVTVQLTAAGAWIAVGASDASGSGDVLGPASSTASVPALFDGITGKIIKNSTPTGTGNPVMQTSPTLTTPVIGVATGTSLAATGLISSASPTAGIGYATGAGSAAVQGTSRTTTVVANTICGSITLFSAAGSATPFSFTVTNSACAATDTIIVSQKSGTDIYTTQVVSAVGAGSFRLTLANASGTTTETPVFNFAVIKAVAA